jgi:hypothetical protein
MSDEVEMPNEAIERHGHAAEHGGHDAAHARGGKDPHAGRMTLVIILLAMGAAIAGKVSSEAELRYLTHDIEQSDIWSQYQGQSSRQAMAEDFARLAAVLPNASDPAVQQSIAWFRTSAAHMASDAQAGNGKEQLAEKARHASELREAAARRLEGFEMVVSVLAIAIGLGSASLLARGRRPRLALGGVSMAAGAAAAVYGILVFFGLA